MNTEWTSTNVDIYNQVKKELTEVIEEYAPEYVISVGESEIVIFLLEESLRFHLIRKILDIAENWNLRGGMSSFHETIAIHMHLEEDEDSIPF